MSFWDAITAIAYVLGVISMLGFLAIIGIAVGYSVKGRAEKRRKAIADAKRRHPAGKAAPVGHQCPICLNPWHHPETCDRCTDILIVLDREVSS
jgi:hypothetical protein